MNVIEQTFAEQLEAETLPVRLRRSSLGVSKRLNDEQSRRQAETFGASPEVVSGRKRLFRRGDANLKRITAVLNLVRQYVHSVTVEYPEDGIRLLRRDRLEEFEARLAQFLDDLSDAVADANEVYQTDIIPEARALLGELHNSSDYPPTLNGQWSIDWEYPSVQPDDRLQQLNPALYEQERQRVQARFEEAIELQEQIFIAQLQEIVAGLVDRLSPQEVQVYRYIGQPYRDLKVRIEEIEEGILELDNDSDNDEDADALNAELIKLTSRKMFSKASSIELRGSRATIETEIAGKVDRKVFDSRHEMFLENGCELSRTKQELKSFHATTVTHLTDFFESFKQLNIGSNAELETLVDEATNAVAGIDVGKLRKTEQDGRDSLRSPLAEIGERLQGLMIDKPRRSISMTDE